MTRLILVLAITGCGASAPSGDDGDPRPLGSLNESCGDNSQTGADVGVTGNDLLAQIQAPYSVTFGLDKLALTTLTLGAAYNGGEIICYPAQNPPPGSLAPNVPAHIEMEVELTFVTADGAFNERVPALLSGSVNTPAGFEASMRASEVQGTYVPNVGTPQIVQLSFSGRFTGAQTNGSVYWGEDAQSGPVGYWPMDIR